MLSVVAFGSTYYLNYLLRNKGGLFFLECNYDVKQTNILPIFYHELLSWWAELREIIDPDRGHEYILWNNKKIDRGQKCFLQTLL